MVGEEIGGWVGGSPESVKVGGGGGGGGGGGAESTTMTSMYLQLSIHLLCTFMSVSTCMFQCRI